MQFGQSLTPSPSIVLLAVSAYFALASSITTLPLSIFLACLLAYASPMEFEAAWPRSTSITAAISMSALGGSLARLGPGMEALSTPIISIVALLLGSTLCATIFLIPIVIFVSSVHQASSPIVKVMLFPALWATTVTIASHGSPVGRVGVWSPVYGMDLYKWLLPYFGEVGQDWIVGLSAILILQVAEQAHWSPPFFFPAATHSPLKMTKPDGQRPSPLEWPNEVIADADRDPTIYYPASTTNTASRVGEQEASHSGWGNLPIRSETIFTAALLAVLALPSIIDPSLVHAYPESPRNTDMTSLTVACIMPTLAPSTSPKTIFETYRAESATYGSLARIHLWPESAVRFDTAKERSEYFEQVRKVAATYGIWVGVGFDDFAPQEAGDARRREGMRRNGLALVGPQGIEFEYLKQNLVPITESFSIAPSSIPPPLHTINIPYGTRGRHKVTRPIVLTAAICLDLAHSSTLAQLPGRADLILAPGKTWDVRVGEVVHQEAALRADEVGSLALWCDAGGLSGVVGRGESGVQRGRGSFVRVVGIPFAEDETRAKTFYARTGDLPSLILVWVPVLLAFGVNTYPQHVEGGAERFNSLRSSVANHARTAYGKTTRLFKSLTAPAASASGNLIEV